MKHGNGTSSLLLEDANGPLRGTLFPLYAAPHLANSPAPARVVRVGMVTTGPDGQRMTVRRLVFVSGDPYAIVSLRDGTEMEVQLSSLH